MKDDRWFLCSPVPWRKTYNERHKVWCIWDATGEVMGTFKKEGDAEYVLELVNKEPMDVNEHCEKCLCPEMVLAERKLGAIQNEA